MLDTNVVMSAIFFGGDPKRIVREAIHRGEYDPTLNANRATALLYSQFEAAIIRLTLSGKAELSESIDAVNSLLFAFRICSPGGSRFI